MQEVDYTARVTESVLARLHFVVRAARPGRRCPTSTSRELEGRLAAAARSWDDDLAEAPGSRARPQEAGALLRVYGEAFPEAYKEDFPAVEGLRDVLRLAALVPDGPLAMAMYAARGRRPTGGGSSCSATARCRCRELLPVLQSLGVEVLDERPYELECGDGRRALGLRRGLRYRAGRPRPPEGADELFTDAFAAVWSGRAEDDGFNALVTRGRLAWRQVVVLRAYARYLRQATSTYSSEYVQEVLATHVGIAALLVQLFEALFDPASADEDAGRGAGRRGHRGARRRGEPRPRPHPAGAAGAGAGDRAHQPLPARPGRRSRSRTWRSSSTRRGCPTCPRPGPGTRSSCTARASRACTCASARSPAAGCAGPTGATTSAPRCSAWSRRRP